MSCLVKMITLQLKLWQRTRSIWNDLPESAILLTHGPPSISHWLPWLGLLLKFLLGQTPRKHLYLYRKEKKSLRFSFSDVEERDFTICTELGGCIIVLTHLPKEWQHLWGTEQSDMSRSALKVQPWRQANCFPHLYKGAMWVIADRDEKHNRLVFLFF